MRAHETYDYAVVRVVPRVERGEFVNVGVILSCEAARFLEARIEVDPARLRALDPDIDLEAGRPAPGRHSRDLPRRRSRGADRPVAGTRPLPLADRPAQRDHPDLARAHGSLRRQPGGDAGAPHGPDGASAGREARRQQHHRAVDSGAPPAGAVRAGRAALPEPAQELAAEGLEPPRPARGSAGFPVTGRQAGAVAGEPEAPTPRRSFRRPNAALILLQYGIRTSDPLAPLLEL